MRSPSRRRLLVAAVLGPLTVPLSAPSAAEPHARIPARDQVVEDPGFENLSVEPCFQGAGGADVSRTDENPLSPPTATSRSSRAESCA